MDFEDNTHLQNGSLIVGVRALLLAKEEALVHYLSLKMLQMKALRTRWTENLTLLLG